MTSNKLSPASLLEFYKVTEKLKTTLRHSWLHDGVRQESVAEHTWMMCLMAVVLAPQMQKKLNLLKVLKMIIVHDLAEAVTSDIPVWDGVKNKAQKDAAEMTAITDIFSHLDDVTQKDLMAVWHEYEQRQSVEAVFVKALDTLDVVAQHNVAPLSTWQDNDFLWQLSPLQDAFFNSDNLLRKTKDQIDKWTIKKVEAANKLDKLDQAELQKRRG